MDFKEFLKQFTCSEQWNTQLTEDAIGAVAIFAPLTLIIYITLWIIY